MCVCWLQMALVTVDDLLRQKVAERPDDPIIGYPDDNLDYIVHTMREVDVFADKYAQYYAQYDALKKPSTVVALLGLSTLDYLLSQVSLARMGCAVLILSVRLNLDAFAHLLKETDCRVVVVSPTFKQTMEQVKAEYVPDLQIVPIATVEHRADIVPHVPYKTERTAADADRTVWIIHSSGSTGYPKPIRTSNKAAISNYVNHPSEFTLCTMPLFHGQGLNNFFRAVNAIKPMYLWSGTLPMTGRGLVQILNKYDFHTMFAVPYTLGLIAAVPGGFEAMAKLKIVLAAGAACPDALGDQLVEHGVNIVCHFGSTEMGHMMTSARAPDDKDWNYLRVAPRAIPFFRFEPREDGLFEMVILDGWPPKVKSNRPDGSYATSDLFQKHPTKENHWKYVCRYDDNLTLVTGEKINPLLIEGAMRLNKYISDVVVFGERRSHAGMFIIPSELARDLSPSQFIEIIQPTLQAASAVAAEHAQISEDMLVILPIDVQVPKTLKATIIRAQFYRQFEKNIDDAYAVFENGSRGSAGTAVLSMNELKVFLKDVLEKILRGRTPIEYDTDLFLAGLDSLQAMQVRSKILRNVNVGGHTLEQNVVFEYPTINAMSEYLHTLSQANGLTNGHANGVNVTLQTMQKLIEKYSKFTAHRPVSSHAGGITVVLTGSTGSLGSHLLNELLRRQDIRKVYCLVRASTAKEAKLRVQKSLEERVLQTNIDNQVEALCVAFEDAKLGLNDETYSRLQAEVTHIIHCAWAVNFNMRVESFEEQHIKGTFNLLNLCLSTQQPQPACFNFCSSLATVMKTPKSPVPEDLATELTYCNPSGYGRSKLVTEKICQAAAQYLPVRILRIGQIVGDSANGVWKMDDAFPLLIRTATKLGALPDLPQVSFKSYDNTNQ